MSASGAPVSEEKVRGLLSVVREHREDTRANNRASFLNVVQHPRFLYLESV